MQLLSAVPIAPVRLAHSTTACELIGVLTSDGISGIGSGKRARPSQTLPPTTPPVGTGPSVPSSGPVPTGPQSGGTSCPGGPQGPMPIRSQASEPTGACTRPRLNSRLPTVGSLSSPCSIGQGGQTPFAQLLPNDVAPPGRRA